MDKKNVEAIFPLTPMQQGLLFHSLQASGEDPGALHMQGRLEGELDPARFADAWKRVAQRHPVLRTVLRWEGLDEPLQIVLRHVEVECAVEDLQSQRPLAQQRQLRAYLDADREAGIDLREAPTMRLALFRTDATTWQFVWSCHHVLLDGWSGALVMQDVITVYNARAQGQTVELSPAPPFQAYARWLKRQPEAEAEAYWRSYLDGVTGPTPLPLAPPDDSTALAPGFERQDVELPTHTTKRLKDAAREQRVTLGAVLYGAWALLLSRYSGRESVVFGSTTSGRAVDVPGVEAMAGLLINTLPIRADVDPDATARSVIQSLHADQADQVQYAHSAPAEIHAWSDVPAHRRLFDSLLVVENFPHATEADGPLALRDLRSGITSNVPLTVIVAPGDALQLHVVYDHRRFGQDAITRLTFDLLYVLEGIAENPEQSARALLPDVTISADSDADDEYVPGDRSRVGQEYVAPRDELERQLVQIWEDVLHVHPVGVRDGFFELGGQSLQAVQLMNRVERRFGKKLPLSLLVEASDVGRMADYLREGTEAALWSPLVPLAPEGTRTPLYCVHSYDGDAMAYRRLAQLLDPDQPVYGLQAVGLDGTTPPLTDVGEMAVRYVEDVQAVQPEGPYALLSICFGIAVTLEMARLLTEQGHTVSHLFVLDSAFGQQSGEFAEAPGATEHAPSSRVTRIARRVFSWQTMRELPVHLAVHGRKHWAPIQRRLSRWKQERVGPQEGRAWRMMEATNKAWDAYRATPYSGPATLLRSSAWSDFGDKRWHVPMWTELAQGGLTVHHVPGNHETMLTEPYVQALASQLRACLAAEPKASTDANGEERRASTVTH